jgi:uncharacterized membrane protein YkvA (DUF1232 family)
MKGKSSPWSLKKDIFTLIFAFRDPQTPIAAKLITLLSLVYLVSPVDFVPDVLPFAGFVDDIVVVPLLLHISNILLPSEVKNRSLAKASKKTKLLNFILIGIVLVVFTLIGLSIYFLFYRH